MKLEEIEQLWTEDSKIDQTSLADESVKIPKLHAKYHQMFDREMLAYKQLYIKLKQLKHQKSLYYAGKGDPQEYQDNPLPVKILKQDVPQYVEVDSDVVKLQKKVDLQEQKTQLLKSIIASINNRHWSIRNAIEWEKFINGGV